MNSKPRNQAEIRQLFNLTLESLSGVICTNVVVSKYTSSRFALDFQPGGFGIFVQLADWSLFASEQIVATSGIPAETGMIVSELQKIVEMRVLKCLYNEETFLMNLSFEEGRRLLIQGDSQNGSGITVNRGDSVYISHEGKGFEIEFHD